MIFHLVAILIVHFIGDFLLQTRSMGLNKGKSIMWLSMHVGVYLIALLTFGIAFSGYVIDDGNLIPIVKWCLLNAVIHWITDFVTSKASGFCYLKMMKAEENGKEGLKHFWQYHFWSVIGFDQLLHASALLITYHYFFV